MGYPKPLGDRHLVQILFKVEMRYLSKQFSLVGYFGHTFSNSYYYKSSHCVHCSADYIILGYLIQGDE